MTHGSLFSGIGGFDLAAEWMGWQNVFHCEWNTFGQRVLKHYWPNAISYNDITKTDFTIHRGRIDILTGGFPCQPYSMAGKRLGKEDDRHLWPEMLRAIREIQPRWVVGENVFGLVNWSDGLVFHEVQADLEAEGYEVQPFVLPAVSVDAPHRRDRVWFVAKNTRLNGCLFGESIEEGAEIRQQRDIGAGDTERICGEEMAGITANAEGVGWRWRGCAPCHQWQNIIQQSGDKGFGSCGTATDTTGEQGEWVRPKFRESCEQEQEQFGGNNSEVGSERNATDTDKHGLQGSIQPGGDGEQGWDRQILSAPEHLHTHGGSAIQRGRWHDFPTQSPICSRNDGISGRLDGITFSKWRNESIKGYGNAVVVPLVEVIFKAINQYREKYD